MPLRVPNTEDAALPRNHVACLAASVLGSAMCVMAGSAGAQSVDLSGFLDAQSRDLAQSTAPVAQIARCAAASATASATASDAADRRKFEEDLSRLVSLIGPVADRTGVPRSRAAAVLAYRLMPVTATSIMPMPPGQKPSAVPSDCSVAADEAQALIDDLAGE
ncbi:hypothetical protein BSY19_4892 (plasmid) [Bosea sp. RAC05]|nr:hypothetical protein BSY19_4892 [Bosea sp. RAC05]